MPQMSYGGYNFPYLRNNVQNLVPGYTAEEVAPQQAPAPVVHGVQPAPVPHLPQVNVLAAWIAAQMAQNQQQQDPQHQEELETTAQINQEEQPQEENVEHIVVVRPTAIRIPEGQGIDMDSFYYSSDEGSDVSSSEVTSDSDVGESESEDSTGYIENHNSQLGHNILMPHGVILMQGNHIVSPVVLRNQGFQGFSCAEYNTDSDSSGSNEPIGDHNCPSNID